MLYVIKFLYSFFIPPGIFVVLMMLTACWLWRRQRTAAKGIALMMVLLYLFSTPYVGAALIRSLESRYNLPDTVYVDAVVVLGGGATAGTPDWGGLGNLSGSAANRLLTAVRLYRMQPVPVIFVGGQVYADSGNEAQTARRLLLDLGVPVDQIIAEDKSLNTTENVQNVKHILQERGWTSLALVTSAFHMERSVLNFRRAGIEITPVPTDYQVSATSAWYVNQFVPSASGMYLSSLAVKEYLGILALNVL